MTKDPKYKDRKELKEFRHETFNYRPFEIKDIIDFEQKFLGQFPEDLVLSADWTFDEGYGGDSSLKLTITRYETDEEYQKRMDKKERLKQRKVEYSDYLAKKESK